MLSSGAMRIPVYVALLCALPRIAALYWFSPDTTGFYYWEASDALLRTGSLQVGGIVDTSMEPLYPALLAALRAIGGGSLTFVLLAQIAIASAAGAVLYRVTEDLADQRAAVIAAVLYAFDPYLVRQSVSLVEITLCVALLVAAARAYSRGDSVHHTLVAGILLGLAVVARFSFLPVAAGALALMLWRRRWVPFAVCAVAVAVPAAAWMLRTHAINGALVPTRIGVNLFISTNQYADQVVPLRNVDLLLPWTYEVVARDTPAASLTDVELQRVVDDALFGKAVAFARAHPLVTAKLKLRNLAYTIAPVLLPLDRTPRTTGVTIDDGRVRISDLEQRPLSEHIIYSTSRLVLLIGACAGLFLRRGCWSRGDTFLCLVAASVIGVQTVFFPTSRLLAPMAFVMMFYTGVAVSALVDRARERRGSPRRDSREAISGGRPPR